MIICETHDVRPCCAESLDGIGHEPQMETNARLVGVLFPAAACVAFQAAVNEFHDMFNDTHNVCMANR